MRPGPWLAGAAIIAALALLGRGLSRRTPEALGRAEARVKLATLREILAKRGDNDPRLDRDFVALTPETKALLREEYRSYPAERRNERGTIVYLLGNNLKTPEDWAFLRDVAAEPPCLSLADCSKPSGEPGELGDEITLAYPSLVAVRQAARAAREGGSKEGALSVLSAARASRVAAVTRLARTIDAGSTAR